MNYQNYHKHSYYSNLATPDSTVSPEDYALRAKELGQSILSSVEHGYPGRYIESYEIAKQYNLKFLFGTEAYIVKNRFEKDKTNAHIVLLAKNENGRKGINRILSEANKTGFYYRPRIDFDLLYSLPKDDVWITSACIAGLWQYDEADNYIADISNNFKENFFLEVQNHNTVGQKDLNYRILDLSNRYNIKVIFGCDSHYINPSQSKDRDNYLLSKHIEYENEADWYMDYPSCEDAIKRFESQGILNKYQIEEAICNTNIFNEVEEYTSEVFKDNVKLPTIYPNKSQNEKNEILSKLIWTKWNEKKKDIPEEKWKHYESEISNEISIIVETNMADYFLLDYEIVKKGKEKEGHLTLTSRGSAPSFFISNLLEFTTIDRISSPVKLFPERFITKERILEAGTLPDIDLNLGNPEAFVNAQIEVLGEDHSYPMIAYGTMQPKAAWKLYARAINMDFEIANYVSKQIDSYEMDLKHLDEGDKDSIDIENYIDNEYKDIYKESKKYLGIISDAKIHACATILYNGNIQEEIGLIKVKDNLCCLMDGLWAEKYKFLKNDLLKVNVVELIYRVYERIGVEPHSLPRLIEICKNNDKVWDVYANAWTMGINQVEQPNTASKVSKYKPKNISELSAFVAAVRPGFKSNYKQFEAREDFSYGIPSLDSLVQTVDFPQSYLIYQENAMQVMAYAGIPISQTYEIIKNIAKKRVEKVLEYENIFLSGMTKRIMDKESKPEEEAKRIAKMTWQIIEDSSHYLFNASHAYSVAGDSLYGAYLKSNYPVEFYEVLLNILEESGEKDRISRTINEAERAYKIKFPKFQFGQDNRYIKGDTQLKQITSSLKTIKGFGSDIGESLYELGKNHYDSFLDFLIDAEEKECIRKKYEDLIRIGYFDCFGGNEKLLNIFHEFSSGKIRYCKSHSEKTKEKRKVLLKEYADNLPNKRFGIAEQMASDQDILGHINTTYPKLNKRFVFITSLDTKFAPRVQAYCLANGKSTSLKVYKKTYENNSFDKSSILYCKDFEKKRPIKYADGIYTEDPDGEYQFWLCNYEVIEASKFDVIIEELDKKK